ncbi:MAG: saccharopine dehydrogenase C-terminal domain-containing protein [Vicinamibacterales bacterium]
MSFTYAVVGAGRQGVAAAYDLAVRGDASRILFVDLREAAAREAAARVNTLAGRQVADGRHGDASDVEAMTAALAGSQAILSAAHYDVNLGLTRVAVSIGAHLVDLGGHTGIVREQHAFDADVRRAGITVVPDTGMGPGLNVSLAAYAMSRLDRARDVFIWDGGLPQAPREPWNYVSTFSMSGLTNEYDGFAYFLRGGEVVEVPAFAGLETLRFEEPVGTLEGFVTSGGLSTAPWTWKGTLERLENKTLRYPGHCARFLAYRDIGLLGQEPIAVGSSTVVPRDVFHALLEPRIGAGPDPVRDVCVMRVKAAGELGGRPAEAVVELVDRYDEATGFTAMQRLTGWHAAICLGLAVRGRLPAGVVAVERVPGGLVVEEGRARGWDIRERVA